MCDNIDVPHKLNIETQEGLYFYFGKNAISIIAFLLGALSLCGNKRSSAFFVRGFV